MFKTRSLDLVTLLGIFVLAGTVVYLEQQRAYRLSLRFGHQGGIESTQLQHVQPVQPVQPAQPVQPVQSAAVKVNVIAPLAPPGDEDNRKVSAATAAAAAAAAAVPTTDRFVLGLEFDDGVLQKRSHSSRMRLVFLVGLEGTGHHYMADVLDKVCKMSKVQCPKVCNLAKALYPDLTNPESPSAYKDARDGVRKEMQALARYAENLPKGTTTIASFGVCRFSAGLMSYPNFEGKDKALQYVDFRIIAEEAERAGVDLRIIYLARSAKAILISNTQHNQYGGTFMKESRVLLANAAVVESTFLELSSTFTTCFRYEDMSDSIQASRVAEFIAPTAASAKRLVTTMLSTVKHNIRPKEQTGMNFSPAKTDEERIKAAEEARLWKEHRKLDLNKSEAHKLIVDRFQQKLDKIERDQCRRDGML